MKGICSMLTAAIAASLFGLATPAHAQTANASAQDLSVHISLLGVISLDVTPQAPSQLVNTDTPTQTDNSLPSVELGNPLVSVSTGLLTSEAQYSSGGTSATGATDTVASLNVSAVSLLSNPLLSITADVISSTSIVSGYCPVITKATSTSGLLDDFLFTNGFDSGNLSAQPPGDTGGGTPPPGDVSLVNLGISILGIPVQNLPLNPPPNTGIDLSLLGIAGASLILNEQTISGDGVTSISKVLNALHLTLNVAGLVTADVAIAHSEASLSCTE